MQSNFLDNVTTPKWKKNFQINTKLLQINLLYNLLIYWQHTGLNNLLDRIKELHISKVQAKEISTGEKDI